MGASATRTGRSIAAVITTVGVINTTAETREFREGEVATGEPLNVRPCLFSSKGGAPDTAFIRINGNDANPASITVYDFRIEGNQTLTRDISVTSRINVQSISIFVVAGSFANIRVVGWPPV